eukprot:CAMPEP_0204265008 /NCGR_PEP_ID=MMETSP0468-20130131/9393_2 /ASSEMBLY_ACC=CAM_ASM_000383 /TAXON_ID=2969 /ORGANISM="Oxyrrhis marina" /LENGTH=75 /DNA_ID=CAMNT_0051239925 /DNA_START=209 /DNA_END=433 /DNA_ORIENTATION=-
MTTDTQRNAWYFPAALPRFPISGSASSLRAKLSNSSVPLENAAATTNCNKIIIAFMTAEWAVERHRAPLPASVQS